MTTIRLLRPLLLASAVLLAGSSFLSSAQAASGWAAAHPRRAEVNGRLANQNARINTERKDGQLTGAQAAHLHTEDHQVRQEERLMASQDGSHITRQEQRNLNQQENAISRQIGK
jgi:hypothetical protein